MIDPRDEANFWRFERVVIWKMDVQEEDTSLIRTIRWTHDSCLPMKKIIADGTCRTLSWGIPPDILQLLVDSF